MRKFLLPLATMGVELLLSGCGVPAEEHEAVQVSASALAAENVELKQQLEASAGKLETAEAEAAALQEAEDERGAAEKAEAERKAKDKAEKEAAAAEAKKKANAAKKVSARELAKIVKDPDSFVDRNVIVYGRVTQFDSATGPCTFRADISHTQVGKYDYEHNSIFSAGDGLSSCGVLKDVVADDFVKITATITGSMSYDTQIGGSTTVPQFKVVKIKRL